MNSAQWYITYYNFTTENRFFKSMSLGSTGKLDMQSQRQKQMFVTEKDYSNEIRQTYQHEFMYKKIIFRFKNYNLN